MEIGDIVFYRFANNLLPKDDMARVAKSLRESGEIGDALQACVTSYEANRKIADDMIGVDTEMEGHEKKCVDGERISADDDSILSNNIKKTIMTANINLTVDEQKSIQSIIESFNTSSANAEATTLEDRLVKFYVEQRPGTFPEDAYQTIKEMRHGIETFNDNLQKALSESGFDYAAELHKLAADISVRQKYDLYANFLAALQTLSASNLSADQLAEIEDYQALRCKLDVDGEVGEDMIADLEAKIVDMLENNTLCLGSTDRLRELVAQLPNGADAIGEVIRGSEEDMRQKLVASMATYIAYQNDQIESMRGKEFTAEAVAIATAAGVEQAHVIDDLNAGRTTVDVAIKVLKIIGGVAMFSILAYFSFLLMIGSASVVSLMLVNLFGTSLIATIGSFTIMCMFLIELGDTLADAGSVVMKWSSRTFDLVVDTWRKVAYPAIAAALTGVGQWLKDKLGSNVLHRQEQQTGDTTVQPVVE